MDKPSCHNRYLDPLASGEARHAVKGVTATMGKYLDPLASGEARPSDFTFDSIDGYLDPLASGEARLVCYWSNVWVKRFRSTSLRRG